MHAITVWQEPDDLRRATREVAAAYVAAGVDPKKHIVFNQSRVHQHAELAWVFNCVARMGWMSRMTQCKDKTAGKNAEAESLGLFAYPSLMAADILLYKATHVPVGDDQKQHLELTRDIAQKFNNDFGPSIKEQGLDADYFPITEPVIQGPATRVMSLRDGHQEDVEVRSVGPVAHPDARRCRRDRQEDQARHHRSRAAALRGGGPRRRGPRPTTSSASMPRSPTPRKAEVLEQFGGQGWGVFKPALADLAVARLTPDRRRDAPADRRPGLDRRLHAGRGRARLRDRRADDVGSAPHRRLHPLTCGARAHLGQCGSLTTGGWCLDRQHERVQAEVPRRRR